MKAAIKRSLHGIIASVLLSACSRSLVVTGRLVDPGMRPAPFTESQVWISLPDSLGWQFKVRTDTTGTFQVRVPRQSGCYLLDVHAVGFRHTRRTFTAGPLGTRDLGDVPLDVIPIDMVIDHVILGCARTSGESAAGTDTVIVTDP